MYSILVYMCACKVLDLDMVEQMCHSPGLKMEKTGWQEGEISATRTNELLHKTSVAHKREREETAKATVSSHNMSIFPPF